MVMDVEDGDAGEISGGDGPEERPGANLDANDMKIDSAERKNNSIAAVGAGNDAGDAGEMQLEF